MAGLAEEEIRAHMGNIREEMEDAVNNMAPEPLMVPAGMTRAEFKEWKVAQTEQAKTRLLELEERLKRLQLLEGKMTRLKTSSGKAIDAVPDHWTLPGFAGDDGSGETWTREAAHLGNGDHDYHGSHGSPEHRYATANGGGDAANKKPMYNRPISPSIIRQIIREELAVAASETIQFETNPVKGQLTDRSHRSGDSKKSQRNPEQEQAYDGNSMTDGQIGRLRFASWMDPAQIEQAEKVEEKRKHHDDLENEPKTLDECVLVSCPLLLGGFSRRNPIRQQCFEIKKNLWWQSFFLCVVISNSLYITLAPELKPQTSEGSESNTEQSEGEFWFDVICAAIMGFEVLVGVITYGLVGSETTYLRNSGFHKLDMVCFLVTVLEYVGQYFQMPNMTLRPFRMLRIFKPICKIKSLHGVKSIIVTMSEGAPQLGIIFLFLMLTIAAWTILGMAIYSKSFRKRCVTMDLQVPVCASDFSTGTFGPTCNFTFDLNHTVTSPGGMVVISQSYPFENWCDIVGLEVEWDEVTEEGIPPPTTDIRRTELFERYKRDGKLYKPGKYDKTGSSWYDSFNAFPKDQYGRWHTCQRNLFFDMNATVTTMCEELGNPSGGFSHFDNLWGSLCSIAQVVVPDSYYDILWRSINSEPTSTGPTIALYFFINVFDTFLLLGLFVAVVTGTFKRVRESHHNVSQFITEGQQDELEQEALLEQKGEDEDISGEQAMMNAAQAVVKSDKFVLLISTTILTQLVAMAVDTYDADETMKTFATIANLVCSIIFILEVTLNYIAAGGLSKFWAKLFHQFELFLVIVSVIGLLTNNPIFRLIPALRGYRLMKYFPTLEDMLKSAVSSVQAIFNVLVFILLVMVCFVVAARYMFGNTIDGLSRSNFGTFALASLTMFQLITGDSWSAVMYTSMQAFPGEQYAAQFFGAFLVMSWFIFASLIAKNLFVAVIIENFQISDTINNIGKPGKVAQFRTLLKSAYSGLYKRSNAVIQGNMQIDINTGTTHPVQAARHHLLNLRGPRALYSYEHAQIGLDAGTLNHNVQKKGVDSDSKILQVVATVTFHQPFEKENQMEDDPERVLFLFLPNNPVRLMFLWIARQAMFETIVYVSILVSCLFLVIQQPFPDIVLYPGQEETLGPLLPIDVGTMAFANSIFTFVFTVEFVCRVMAQGLISTKQAYLKSGWNIVDTIVLVFAWIEEMVGDASNYKALRMGRALKPLRLMKRNQNMRVVIDALISTLQPLVYVILFLIFTLVIFGMIAMGLFGGKLHSCNNPAVQYPMGKTECSNFYTMMGGNLAGVVFPTAWTKPYTFGFDTYSDSLMSLLQVSSFKYVSIIYACMDVTEVNSAPSTNASMSSALFFVVYIFFGGLFVMNLFVGFIIDGFNANKGTSNEEMIYGRFRRQLKSQRPVYATFKPPKNRYSTASRRFIESPAFQSFSTACVVTNVCFLLADNADAEPGTNYYFLLETQNTAFFIELCFEVVVCSIGYGLGGFYNDIWRGFDLFVCLGQSAGLAANSPLVQRGAKVFRLARVVRLAARIKAVRVILETFIHTVPQLTNIILLIFLFYSMFAVMGVTFFATTKVGLRHGDTANFRSWMSGFMTIFQIVTGDEWMVIMQDLSVQPPYCDMLFTKETVYGYSGPNRTWGDCGQSFSGVFFLAVKLVCEYVLLNLFIGLILDNFSYITEDVGHEEDARWSAGPSGDQLQQLCEVFKLYDRCSSYVPISSLHALLCDLPLPLGYRKSDGKMRIKKQDIVLELLIRAELNLAIRHEREQVIERNKHWTRRMGLKKREGKKLFINAVDFEVLMVTLLHWRMPVLVPPIVKWQRQERVEECALVAHALQCVEFFRMLVGRRKRKRIGEMLAKRSRFMHWSDHDPHRKRRNVHTVKDRLEMKDLALTNKVPILHYLNTPIDTYNIVLEWLLVDDIPEEFVDHNKAVREYHLMRVPQPITGIELFRQKLSKFAIVMRLIDPNNKDPIGDLVVADFSKVGWREWKPVSTKHESFFQPQTQATFAENKRMNPHVGWDRVDLYMKPKSSAKGRQVESSA